MNFFGTTRLNLCQILYGAREWVFGSTFSFETRALSRAPTVNSLLNDMLVFKHPGIIIRVYGFKIFVLKNGTARCSFS